MKTLFAILGAVVFVLWLASFLGVGQFILYYGRPGVTLTHEDDAK